MGRDTVIMLPNDVRVRDVANVIGVLAGLPSRQERVSDNEGFFVRVDGAKVRSSSGLPSCAEIHLKGDLIDGQSYHYVLFHFEPDERYGCGRVLLPPATPFWQAIGRGLIKFFGGKIDLDDCDSVEIDEVARKRYRNNPSDDPEWSKFQRRIFNLKPAVL